MLMLATLNAVPPQILPTDNVSTAGGILRIRRDGAILFSVDLRPVSVPFTGVVLASQIQPNQIYWERTMPAQSFALVDVIHNLGTGITRFKFDDGSEETRTEWSQCQEDVDAVQNEAIAKKALIAKSYIMDPTGANRTLMVGGSCTINLQADEEFLLVEPA